MDNVIWSASRGNRAFVGANVLLRLLGGAGMRDWGPIDPGIVEHDWKGNGKRCEICGWLDGQHYWPWDSRGG